MAENENAKAAAEEKDPSTELQIDAGTRATYSNLCRITGTPEEMILDFALNPNAFGTVLNESIKVDHRIVMGYEAAKRAGLVLLETVRRHEAIFGVIELDPRKRIRENRAATAQAAAETPTA